MYELLIKKEKKIGSKLQGTRYEYGDNWSSSRITFSNSMYGMITITLLEKNPVIHVTDLCYYIYYIVADRWFFTYFYFHGLQDNQI